MDNQRLVDDWHAAILEDCVRILERELNEPERRFIVSRGGFIALEMIHDRIKNLSESPEELSRYLNSEESDAVRKIAEGLLLENPGLLLPWTDDCDCLSRVGDPEVGRAGSLVSIAWKGRTALGIEVDVWYCSDMPSTFLLIPKEKFPTASKEYDALLGRLVERLGPPHANGQSERYPGTAIYLPWSRWACGDATVGLSVAERFGASCTLAVSRAGGDGKAQAGRAGLDLIPVRIRELEPLLRRLAPLKGKRGGNDIHAEVLKDAAAAANDFMARQVCRRVVTMCHPKAWGDRSVDGYDAFRWNAFLGELRTLAADCVEKIGAREAAAGEKPS